MTVRIFATEKNWIEGEAVRQLERAASLPGMEEVVGLPDLHPGKGYPIGAAFASPDMLYPYLIGNDIGCGVALWQTDLLFNKFKFERFEKRLANMVKGLDSASDGQLALAHAMGTLGGGNHFAELQKLDRIEMEEDFVRLGLKENALTLLVHSGSRGLGEMILRDHVDHFRDAGLKADSPEASSYLARHAEALIWAQQNRKALAETVLSAVSADGVPVLDIAHNFIAQETVAGRALWVHRKGAISSQAQAVIIPGSRGGLTYLVRPTGDPAVSLHSLPHGAGRKWQRGECRGRLEQKYRHEDLLRTSLGGRVICRNRDLLYEEAPQAYKNIDTVINDLITHGLAEIIATFRPVVTVKDL
ncbi:MAG: RNA ligase RtcB family protein [Pseudomonadota bacterium]